jgi:hypothetical protein
MTLLITLFFSFLIRQLRHPRGGTGVGADNRNSTNYRGSDAYQTNRRSDQPMPMPRRTTLNRETELATRTTTIGTEFNHENNENSVVGQQSVTPFSQTNTNTINNNDGSSNNNNTSGNNPKNRRKSSLLGYFFGESDAEKEQHDEAERKKRNNDIIPRINGKRVLDAEVDVIPSGTREFTFKILFSPL